MSCSLIFICSFDAYVVNSGFSHVYVFETKSGARQLSCIIPALLLFTILLINFPSVSSFQLLLFTFSDVNMYAISYPSLSVVSL